MLHTALAALGLLSCIVLAVHMALPARLRNRLDARLRRLVALLQAQIDRLSGWRRRQRLSRAASLEAQRVIRRARETSLQEQGRPQGDWDGNVYRPKNFEKPKKPH